MTTQSQAPSGPYTVVLGIAQDAGVPHAGCRRPCCEQARLDPSLRRYAACLAVVDPLSKQRWIIDATPDFKDQLGLLDAIAPVDARPGIDGILLTHAHIGHYTGLIHLGREALGTRHVPVYAMPRMRGFLESNGPWEQLVTLGNIELRDLADDQPTALNDRLRVTPLTVPHRDEYSETVGFRIEGPGRSVLYLPDIDKWQQWGRRIEDELARVDMAYLDATFFDSDEVGGRAMDTIPHPFLAESIERFAALSAKQRSKVRFIHLNHTNPVLNPSGPAAGRVRQAGHGVAQRGEIVPLGA